MHRTSREKSGDATAPPLVGTGAGAGGFVKKLTSKITVTAVTATTRQVTKQNILVERRFCGGLAVRGVWRKSGDRTNGVMASSKSSVSSMARDDQPFRPAQQNSDEMNKQSIAKNGLAAANEAAAPPKKLRLLAAAAAAVSSLPAPPPFVVANTAAAAAAASSLPPPPLSVDVAKQRLATTLANEHASNADRERDYFNFARATLPVTSKARAHRNVLAVRRRLVDGIAARVAALHEHGVETFVAIARNGPRASMTAFGTHRFVDVLKTDLFQTALRRVFVNPNHHVVKLTSYKKAKKRQHDDDDDGGD